MAIENKQTQNKPFSISSINPTMACLALTAIAVVGMFISLGSHNPLWILVLLLPTVAYEIYRTEPGASTKFSSILLLVILILEIGLIVFGIHYNLAEFLETDQKYVAGYDIPLGDIQVFGPLLTAILAAVLVFRTYGPYTKWLSIIIAVGSLVAVYMINPLFFKEALKLIVNGLFNQLSYAIF
jgi:hypothetical protein